MRRPLTLVLLAAAALALAGCTSSRPYAHKTAQPLPTSCTPNCKAKAAPAVAVPAVYQHGDPTAGKHTFVTGPCAGCHTLADAGTHGTVGPNLTGLKVPLSLAIDRLLHGKNAMPPFKGTLSDKQIADVAAYVVQASAK
ncbi:MAG TPA: cytochrome c [Gaiellaceae bacterium]|nr:cytochrome c [Gaiellaceae bacterium]